MILVPTESPQSLECAHTNEGAMKGHQADERITCLLQLHDDFVDFFFDFVHLYSMVDLIIKLSKENIMTLIYLIKLLKPKQNMMIK